MTKAEILAEIKRTAADNGGSALGMRTFEALTGIRYADWFGIHWRSWGEAVLEAGFTPNTLTTKIDDEDLLVMYSLLAREIGRFPTKGDFRLKKRRDRSFPNDSVYIRRFGSYPALRSRAREFCATRAEFADVMSLLGSDGNSVGHPDREPARLTTGFVYLVKHGSRPEYKIGKTFNPLRREGEVRLQLPEKLTPVHRIETDDPAGVEAYWHGRFAAKRKEGEWFALTRDDVAAFKRWKRIV